MSVPHERRDQSRRGVFEAACVRFAQDVASLGRSPREDQLRDSARAFATEARRAGAPVQRMVAALKLCMEDTRLNITRVESHKSRDVAFKAALDAYYDTGH